MTTVYLYENPEDPEDQSVKWYKVGSVTSLWDAIVKVADKIGLEPDEMFGMSDESELTEKISENGVIYWEDNRELNGICYHPTNDKLALQFADQQVEDYFNNRAINKVMTSSSSSPNQLAAQLRRIASAITNSKNPRRDLVAKDLKQILASVDYTVWKINIDKSSMLSEGFDGEQDRFSQAEKEVQEVLSEHGVKQIHDYPDSAYFAGDLEAFKELTESAASERPDDDVDLILAYWSVEPEIINVDYER